MVNINNKIPFSLKRERYPTTCYTMDKQHHYASETCQLQKDRHSIVPSHKLSEVVKGRKVKGEKR